MFKYNIIKYSTFELCSCTLQKWNIHWRLQRTHQNCARTVPKITSCQPLVERVNSAHSRVQNAVLLVHDGTCITSTNAVKHQQRTKHPLSDGRQTSMAGVGFAAVEIET